MDKVDELIEKVKRAWCDDNGVWNPLVDQSLLDALVLLRALTAGNAALRDTIAIEAMRVLLEKAYDKPLSLAQADALLGTIPEAAYAYADEMLSVRALVKEE